MQEHVFAKEAQHEDSELVQQCRNSLENSHKEVVDQQERLLKSQTEVKLALEQCKDLRRDTEDDFQKFCKDTFQTVIAEIATASIEVSSTDSYFFCYFPVFCFSLKLALNLLRKSKKKIPFPCAKVKVITS